MTMWVRQFAFYGASGGSSGHSNSVGAGAAAGAGSGSSVGSGSYLDRHKAFLDNNFTKEFAAETQTLLSRAPESMQKLFGMFADRLDYGGLPQRYGELVGRTYTNEDAFHAPFTNKVYFDEGVVFEGDIITTPLNTYFHEFAHQIDYVLSQTSVGMRAISLNNGALGEALKQDVINLMEDARDMNPDVKLNEKQAATKVVEAFRNTYGFDWGDAEKRRRLSDVSDMLQAGFETLNPAHMIHPTMSLGAGHKEGYFKDRDASRIGGAGTEAFAEITAAIISSPESLKVIKDQFPGTYKAYNDIVDFIISKDI